MMLRLLALSAAALLAMACASETTPGDDAAVAIDTATVADTPSTDVALPKDTASPPKEDTPQGPPPDGLGGDMGGEHGGGPATCATDADCLGTNCMGLLGCTCVETPSGKICVPLCKVASDCPAPPDVELECAADGKCKPKGLEHSGTPCTVDADCAAQCQNPAGCTCVSGGCVGGESQNPACTTTADCATACPPGAKGCDCVNPPGMCVPTCETVADCPSQDGATVECKGGHCEPSGKK